MCVYRISLPELKLVVDLFKLEKNRIEQSNYLETKAVIKICAPKIKQQYQISKQQILNNVSNNKKEKALEHSTPIYEIK